jgi:hypothetical protein
MPKIREICTRHRDLRLAASDGVTSLVRLRSDESPRECDCTASGRPRVGRPRTQPLYSAFIFHPKGVTRAFPESAGQGLSQALYSAFIFHPKGVTRAFPSNVIAWRESRDRAQLSRSREEQGELFIFSPSCGSLCHSARCGSSGSLPLSHSASPGPGPGRPRNGRTPPGTGMTRIAGVGFNRRRRFRTPSPSQSLKPEFRRPGVPCCPEPRSDLELEQLHRSTWLGFTIVAHHRGVHAAAAKTRRRLLTTLPRPTGGP